MKNPRHKKVKEYIKDKQHRNHIAMIAGCIRDSIGNILGERKCDPETYKESIDFLFGDGIINFIDQYSIPFDAIEMKKLIFSYMVDFHHKRKRKTFMNKGAKKIFETCLLDVFDLNDMEDEESEE